jgi:hypothetical protein
MELYFYHFQEESSAFQHYFVTIPLYSLNFTLAVHARAEKV